MLRNSFPFPTILSATDYYPFGMAIKSRNHALDNTDTEKYPYGFGGQQKSDEIDAAGNSYTAQFWQYDARIGRRWNIDPVDQISISNYAAFGNNPISRVDPLGDDDFFSTSGEPLFSTPQGSAIRVVTSGAAKDAILKDINTHTKQPSQFQYSANDGANRQMISNIAGHYGKKVGYNRSIGVRETQQGAAFLYYLTTDAEVYVAIKDNSINASADDFYNFQNSIVHEKVHYDDHNTWDAFGETSAILLQARHGTFCETTDKFKKGVLSYAAGNLNKAFAQYGQNAIVSRMMELNNSPLGDESGLLYFDSFDNQNPVKYFTGSWDEFNELTNNTGILQ